MGHGSSGDEAIKLRPIDEPAWRMLRRQFTLIESLVKREAPLYFANDTTHGVRDGAEVRLAGLQVYSDEADWVHVWKGQ